MQIKPAKFSLAAALVLAAALAQGAPEKGRGAAYEFYTKGVELEGHKKYAEACESFKKAIDMQPNFVAPYFESARSFMMIGKRKEAMDLLSNAEKVAVKKAEKQKISQDRARFAEIFYTNTTFQNYQNGLNYIHLERYGAAVEALQLALSTEPDNVAILLAISDAWQRDGNAVAATDALERAFTINPEKIEVRVALAEMEVVKHPQRAVTLLESILPSVQDNEKASVIYARALTGFEHQKEAIEFLRGRVDNNPEWITAMFWLGKLYSQSSDGAWMARKYLMTFLKREDGSNLPPTMKEEAASLLTRINETLR